MREFPTLADVIDKHTPSGAEGHVTCWCGEQFSSFREHAEHVAAAWRDACTIRTVEELDALPFGAVVRTECGSITDRYRDEDGTLEWWVDGSPDAGVGEDLPALLIWHPDWRQP